MLKSGRERQGRANRQKEARVRDETRLLALEHWKKKKKDRWRRGARVKYYNKQEKK